MKWGSRYGPEFVNRLYTSIKRHTKKTTKVYCFTDDTKDINENVICKPLPEICLPNIISLTPWRKLSIWKFPLYDLKGDVLFLDLDLVITGNLDRFFDYKPGCYCVIENWTQLEKILEILVVLGFLSENMIQSSKILKIIRLKFGKNTILSKHI